jgi:hypothetical protein
MCLPLLWYLGNPSIRNFGTLADRPDPSSLTWGLIYRSIDAPKRVFACVQEQDITTIPPSPAAFSWVDITGTPASTGGGSTQAQWFVNDSTGLVTNDGTAPVQGAGDVGPIPFGEWGRRILEAGGVAAGVAMVVHIGATITTMAWGTVNVQSAQIVFVGTSAITILQTGLFSATQQPNPGANVYQTGTDSLGRSWAAFISDAPLGIRVRNTTPGPRLNSSFLPWVNLGAGVCQFSQPFAAPDLTLGAFGQSMSSLLTGDTYAVEQLPIVAVAWGLSFSTDSEGGAFNLQEAIQFQDLCMSPLNFAALPVMTTNCYFSIAFFGCDLGVMRLNSPTAAYVNCRRVLLLEAGTSPEGSVGGEEFVLGGLTRRGLRITNGNGLVDQRHACDSIVIQGAGALVVASAQMNVSGIELRACMGGVELDPLLGPREIFGLVAAQFGIFMDEGTFATYSGPTPAGITVAGSVGDVGFGRALLAKSYAQLPFIASDIAGGSGTTFSGLIRLD